VLAFSLGEKYSTHKINVNIEYNFFRIFTYKFGVKKGVDPHAPPARLPGPRAAEGPADADYE
jgi:hypothetical protein